MKFELYFPCKPYAVNQKFGGNGAYYQQNGINIVGHNGTDLRAVHGQPVYAAHDGYAYHQVDSSSGCGVIVISNKEYEYKKTTAYYKSIYWHLCDYSKEPKYKSPVLDYQQHNKGKPLPVKTGDLIGYADNTGLSTGDHLHFGLKPMRPGVPVNQYQDAADLGTSNWQNIEQYNGYLGAIDPAPYFNGKYALDVKAPGMTIEEYNAATAGKQQSTQTEDAAKIVKAIEDLKKVESPTNKAVIAKIVADLWTRFIALFK